MTLTLIKSKDRGANRPSIPKQKREGPELRIVLTADQQYMDLRLRREDCQGFRIEVWQTAESRGTLKPKYYNLRFNLALRRPQPRRSQEFDTVERALSNARADAGRWRQLLDQRKGEKRPKRRSRRREVPLRAERDRIEALGTVADLCRHGDPLCPVCSQQVNVQEIRAILGATGTAY